MARPAKPVVFRGSSMEDLRAFPDDARRTAGFQLDRVQHGEAPSDWKPMNSVGAGALELRIRAEDAAFRVIYVAKFADAIYVCTASRRSRSGRAKRTSLWRRAVTSNCWRIGDEQETV